MIKFPDGELLDLLPVGMKNDTDMICLSYALKKAMERLLFYERSAMTQNFVDSLPEKILDVLAVELRSPYYMESMAIEVKRKIIKNTLIWHTKAGTTAAVSEMIETVFGVGEVVEWPDFEEGPFTPGTFDIVTNAQMTEDVVEFFMSVIERVKNVRSHVRRVLIHREMGMHEYVGSGINTSPSRVFINHDPDDGGEVHMGESAAAAVNASPSRWLTNNGGDKSRQGDGKESAAAMAASMPKETITNIVANTSGSVSGREHAGAAATSSPTELIGNCAGNANRRLSGTQRTAGFAFSEPMVQITTISRKAANLAKSATVGARLVTSPRIQI